MIVVNPDNVSITDTGSNSFCEDAIGFFVSLPGRLVKLDLARMVVEQRPQY